MSCPIKTTGEAYIICQQALRYWYDEKMNLRDMTMDEAKKIINEYEQVEIILQQKFGTVKNNG